MEAYAQLTDLFDDAPQTALPAIDTPWGELSAQRLPEKDGQIPHLFTIGGQPWTAVSDREIKELARWLSRQPGQNLEQLLEMTLGATRRHSPWGSDKSRIELLKEGRDYFVAQRPWHPAHALRAAMAYALWPHLSKGERHRRNPNSDVDSTQPKLHVSTFARRTGLMHQDDPEARALLEKACGKERAKQVPRGKAELSNSVGIRDHYDPGASDQYPVGPLGRAAAIGVLLAIHGPMLHESIRHRRADLAEVASQDLMWISRIGDQARHGATPVRLLRSLTQRGILSNRRNADGTIRHWEIHEAEGFLGRMASGDMTRDEMLAPLETAGLQHARVSIDGQELEIVPMQRGFQARSAGDDLNHCVGTRVADARCDMEWEASGALFDVFRGGDRLLTGQLSREEGGWKLIELKAFENGVPKPIHEAMTCLALKVQGVIIGKNDRRDGFDFGQLMPEVEEATRRGHALLELSPLGEAPECDDMLIEEAQDDEPKPLRGQNLKLRQLEERVERMAWKMLPAWVRARSQGKHIRIGTTAIQLGGSQNTAESWGSTDDCRIDDDIEEGVQAWEATIHSGTLPSGDQVSEMRALINNTYLAGEVSLTVRLSESGKLHVRWRGAGSGRQSDPYLSECRQLKATKLLEAVRRSFPEFAPQGEHPALEALIEIEGAKERKAIELWRSLGKSPDELDDFPF